jgi:hypothetical protein
MGLQLNGTVRIGQPRQVTRTYTHGGYTTGMATVEWALDVSDDAGLVMTLYAPTLCGLRANSGPIFEAFGIEAK